ncbi:MAG: preprotein translocase subunit SecE [Lachnospiraceae bacterium]|nr:preprotein translocase subunit SecE [Lachnospiraceae bacterium]
MAETDKKVKAIDDAGLAEESAANQAESGSEKKAEPAKKEQSAKKSKDGKSSKKGKKNSKNQSQGLKGVLKGLRTEFSKITWPDRNEITKETITVLVVSAILGLCIFGLDKLIIWVLFQMMKIS